MSLRRKLLQKVAKLLTDSAKPLQDAHVQTRIMDGPAEGYIYNILDTKNGKNYIGSKLGAIDKTEDYLGSGTIIKNIANKRPNDLYKTILGKTNTRREMMTQEEAWLKAYRAAQDDNMYNLRNSYHGQLDLKHTKTAKDKISKARKGREAWNKGKKLGPMSEEQKALRRGVAPPNKGKKLSEEVRKRISDGHKGQKAWNKGKKFSEESKRKMSESSRGQKAWNKGMTKEDEAIYKSLNKEERVQFKKGKGLLDD